MALIPWGPRNRPAAVLLAAWFLIAFGNPGTSAQTPQPAPPRAAPAPAASRSDAPLPTARTIIDRHIAAVGGRKAIMARSSLHATGTVSIASQGMTGQVELFAAKPNKVLQRITLGGIGGLEEGFDGTIGW